MPPRHKKRQKVSFTENNLHKFREIVDHGTYYTNLTFSIPGFLHKNKVFCIF